MAMYRPQIDNWHDKDSNPMDGDTPKRLSEPADGPDFKTHGIEKGTYASGGTVELDAAAIQNLTQSLMNQKRYLQ